MIPDNGYEKYKILQLVPFLIYDSEALPAL